MIGNAFSNCLNEMTAVGITPSGLEFFDTFIPTSDPLVCGPNVRESLSQFYVPYDPLKGGKWREYAKNLLEGVVLPKLDASPVPDRWPYNCMHHQRLFDTVPVFFKQSNALGALAPHNKSMLQVLQHRLLSPSGNVTLD